jgi:hypothetical protein
LALFCFLERVLLWPWTVILSIFVSQVAMITAVSYHAWCDLQYFIFFGWIGIWIQGFILAKQAATPPTHFALVILKMESPKLLAWAGLNLDPPISASWVTGAWQDIS